MAKINKLWTDEENRLLIEKYPDGNKMELAAELGRTPQAIEQHVKWLRARGIEIKNPRAWTEEEDRYLRENHGKMTVSELAAHLGRPEGSTQQHMRALGLGRTVRRWSNEETAYLRQHFAPGAKGSTKEMASVLGRSEVSVMQKAEKLGLRQKRQRTTEAERKRALKLWRNQIKVPEIARRLERSPDTIIYLLGKEYDPKRDGSIKTEMPMKSRVIPHLKDIYGRYKEGLSLAELAAEYEITANYLGQILNEYGYPLNELSFPQRSKAISPSGIGPFEFIEAWQNSRTFHDVYEALGERLSPQTITTRAYNYIRRGIPLKKLRRSSGYDWDQLADFAELVLNEEE